MAVALDGPLMPELALKSRYRACEAILSCGILQKRGKPGQSNAGSGPTLHKEATRLANFIFDQLNVDTAIHSSPMGRIPARVLPVRLARVW